MAMLHHIRLLLENAAPLERAGHWQSAISVCEEAFQRSVCAGDVESLTESVLRIGNSYRQLGNLELATEYLELALTIAQRGDDYGRAGRALNGLAALHHVRGELDLAEEIYGQAQVMAGVANDDLVIGNVAQNLGTLSNIRGDLRAALRHYEAALHSYTRIGHDRGIAGVLNNLGMLHIDLSELDAAEETLNNALSVARKIGDIIKEGIILTNRTELYIARCEPDRARASCDEAFEISSRVGDDRMKAEALKFYGIIYRQTNRIYLAEVHLRQAIEIAADAKDMLTEAETQRELALVLRAQDQNQAALEALNRSHSIFAALSAERDQDDVFRKIGQLEDDFLSVVRLWGESIEAKDLYTSGHCERVADYACLIAAEAGIPKHDIVWFRMGAFLHDVGKTEVPEEILNKPGRLTDEERQIMERHTVAGDEMLAHIPFPWPIRPMVRSHHERWDGRGYPDRLKEEDIPLTARILHIADVFDALTTARSYREPLPAHRALEIMQSDHGSYDPELFQLFLQLFPQLAAMIPEEAQVSLQEATATA